MKLAALFIVGFVAGALTVKLLSKPELCPEHAATGQVCAPSAAQQDEKATVLLPMPKAESDDAVATPRVTPEPSKEELMAEATKGLPQDGVTPLVGAKVKESRLAKIRDIQDARDFLRSNVWKDAMQKILSSKPISEMEPHIEALNGRYAGDVAVGRRTWQMVFELDGNVINSQFRGKLNVTLSENGKVFSQHSGQGPIREVRAMSDGSQAIYLEASPRHHFQIYTVSESDMMMGTLYMNDRNPAEFRRRGTAILYRQ